MYSVTLPPSIFPFFSLSEGWRTFANSNTGALCCKGVIEIISEQVHEASSNVVEVHYSFDLPSIHGAVVNMPDSIFGQTKNNIMSLII